MSHNEFKKYVKLRIESGSASSKEIARLNHALLLLDQLEFPRSGLKHCRSNTTRQVYHFYSYTNLIYIFFEQLKVVIALKFGIPCNPDKDSVTKIFSDPKLQNIKIKRVTLSKYLLDLYDDLNKLFSKSNRSFRFDFTHDSGMKLWAAAFFLGDSLRGSLVGQVEMHHVLLKRQLEIIFGHINALP